MASGHRWSDGVGELCHNGQSLLFLEILKHVVMREKLKNRVGQGSEAFLVTEWENEPRRNIETREELGHFFVVPCFLQEILSYLQDPGHGWLKWYRAGTPGFLCDAYSWMLHWMLC